MFLSALQYIFKSAHFDHWFLQALLMSAADESVAFFRSLSSYQKRMETFQNWPYRGRNKCTPERLAQSGFFHPPNTGSDVAQCFVCFKELEGWEPDVSS